ncbi:hypothetical protein, partial [Olsenella uli]|uniref:hypothetical protein n=1 Tax=Olsenella uli TaxID=133926 RepID=UPI003D7A08E1
GEAHVGRGLAAAGGGCEFTHRFGLDQIWLRKVVCSELIPRNLGFLEASSEGSRFEPKNT